MPCSMQEEAEVARGKRGQAGVQGEMAAGAGAVGDAVGAGSRQSTGSWMAGAPFLLFPTSAGCVPEERSCRQDVALLVVPP